MFGYFGPHTNTVHVQEEIVPTHFQIAIKVRALKNNCWGLHPGRFYKVVIDAITYDGVDRCDCRLHIKDNSWGLTSSVTNPKEVESLVISGLASLGSEWNGFKPVSMNITKLQTKNEE